MNREYRLVQLLLRTWPFPRGSGRITDRFFSKLVFNETIAKVRTTDGFEMCVPPNDTVGRHIYLTGEFDRAVVEVLLTFSAPGDVLLDIGANLGYVSGCFLHRTRASVALAVEPQPFIVDLLRQNLQQFEHRQRVFSIALSDCDGESWFYVDPRNRGKSRLVESNLEGARRVETMSAGRFLNKLNLKKLDLLKIDVEGHERTILQGAKEELGSLQPRAIVFEGNQQSIGPGGGAVGAILRDIGYEIYGLRKRLFRLSLEPVSNTSSESYNDYVAVSRLRAIPSRALRAYAL